MHDIHPAGLVATAAFGINSNGQITGYYVPNDLNYHAFIYDGAWHDLGSIGGPSSIGYAINNAGHIAGWATTSSGEDRAFFYDGLMHDLGTLGGSISVGLGINDQDRVTGYSFTADGSTHVFLYDGAMHDLGTLGGADAQGDDINNLGQIVGTSYTAGYADVHAFLYDPLLGMRDLNDLIDPLSSWELIHAKAINDVGQITGYGWYDGEVHAFLLTPVPEPASAMLAILGLVGSVWLTRKCQTGRMSAASNCTT
jgi:probable HAF family extracellular repeat protein